MSSRVTSAICSSGHPSINNPRNLAQVLKRVQESTDLTPRQRQDIASALRTVARYSQRALDQLSCGVPSVRELLAGIEPARHGISMGRWTNVRSLVFRGLNIAGVKRRPGRSSKPLSPAWSALLEPLPFKPLRVALLPFARDCTERGIEPKAVTADVFEAFGATLEALAVRARPREAFMAAVRAWNTAAVGYPDWPVGPISVVQRRDHYSLPWSDFPRSLKADVDAMMRAAISPDPIDPTSRQPIREISAKNRERLLRMLASAIVHSGHRTEDLKLIRDLLALERAKNGLRFIHGRQAEKKTTHVHQIAKLLCTLGRHWVRVSEDHLEALVAIARHVAPSPSGMTEKNRATLRCFEDESLVSAFVSLPQRVWRRYSGCKALKVSEAVKLQLAFVVELLTHAPVRCKNLIGLRLDMHIIDQGTGRNRKVFLHIPREDVKNEVDLEFLLPASAVELLDRYLKLVRPLLLRADSPYLFPGEGGGPKGAGLMSEQLGDFVGSEIGVRLTAHQFRHLAGFLYLRDNPGGYEVVRRFLGHRSIETTVRFYAGLEVASAFRLHERQIAKLRASATEFGRRRSGRRAA